MHRRTLFAAAAALGCALAPPAGAELAWPTRPVTLIVPFAAGGPTDVLARGLTAALSRELGQPVVAENVTGAGGTIGAARVAAARPDGYTLLLGNIGVATSATLYRRLPYDPATAFETIGLVSPVPMVLVGRPGLPPRDVPELLAWARQRGEDVLGDGGLLVRQELQADCLAGVWAHHAQARHQWLQPGDIEEALNTATAIGDDRLQKQARGTVSPESFSHGTSRQRVTWFRTGFDGGQIAGCDTFSAARL